jgi:AraC-like DNA-binding protein
LKILKINFLQFIYQRRCPIFFWNPISEVKEKSTGYAYCYIRELFKSYTKQSLKSYIIHRKIVYCVFEIEISDKKLMDITLEYHFDSYDTFTRCFKRVIRTAPQNYRLKRMKKTKIGLIAMGAYAPVLDEQQSILTNQNEASTIIYGILPVSFNTGKCIPLFGCIESILFYLGITNFTYSWMVNAIGASLRICWQKDQINASNSYIMHLNSLTEEAIYNRTFSSVQRSNQLFTKENNRFA